MKTLFVAFAALLFAFFLGCQSSITDPVVSEQSNMTATVDEETFAFKDAISCWPGFIKLDGNICEPIHNTCNTTLIAGVIRYDIKPIITGNHTVRALRVGLYINAEFKPNFDETNGPWRVFGMTQDIVSLRASNGEVYTLDKEFLVTNTDNYRLKLALSFKVTKNDLTIISMELKKRADIPIGDPEY
jgi:hypothetical protein